MTPDELKTKRLALGLTQEQLAHKIGYTVRQINKYEAGKAKIPQIVKVAIGAL